MRKRCVFCSWPLSLNVPKGASMGNGWIDTHTLKKSRPAALFFSLADPDNVYTPALWYFVENYDFLRHTAFLGNNISDIVWLNPCESHLFFLLCGATMLPVTVKKLEAFCFSWIKSRAIRRKKISLWNTVDVDCWLYSSWENVFSLLMSSKWLFQLIVTAIWVALVFNPMLRESLLKGHGCKICNFNLGSSSSHPFLGDIIKMVFFFYSLCSVSDWNIDVNV